MDEVGLEKEKTVRFSSNKMKISFMVENNFLSIITQEFHLCYLFFGPAYKDNLRKKI